MISLVSKVTFQYELYEKIIIYFKKRMKDFFIYKKYDGKVRLENKKKKKKKRQTRKRCII
jgi:hypothetical protein